MSLTNSLMSKIKTGLLIATILVVLYLAMIGPFGVLLLAGTGSQMILDRLSGKPLRLQTQTISLSPNGKTRFLANPDGSLRLVDVATGHVLQSHHIAPDKYYRVEAEWQGNQQVCVILRLRYAALTNGVSHLWNIPPGNQTAWP